MRILMANEEFGSGSGAGVYFIETARGLTGRGHEIFFLTGSPSTPDEAQGIGTNVHAPGALGFIHRSDRETLRPVREAISRYKPDVIYSLQVLNPQVMNIFNDEAPTVRYALGIRLTCPTGRRLPRTRDAICTKPFDAMCLWKAHTQLCMPRRPDTALKVWTDVRKNQRANARSHLILTPSRYVRDLLAESGLPPDRLEILHPFIAPGPESEAVSPAADRRIVALGRAGPEKGFEHLIEALGHIEAPTTLELYVEGPHTEELRRLGERAPSQHTVRFPGWIPQERLTEAYARARVVAVPSIWPEPFGIVGIEAMAHGVPTVGFDVGGISDWLADGKTGTLVPRKDVAALARALEAYLSDPELARRHGEAGRDEVRQRFLPEMHFERLSQIFEDAAASRPFA